MTDWNEDWVVLERPRDGARRMISVDAGARHAVFAARPHRIAVRIPMLRPRPDGLRSNEESDALWDLQEQVSASLARFGAALVGRILFAGRTELAYHARDAVDVEQVRAACGDTAPYTLGIEVAHEPTWSFYRAELAPTPYEYHCAWNAKLVDQRVERHRDRLDVPREVDHVALFSTREALEEAARRLAARGFRIDPPNLEELTLEFHRDERLDGSRPDEFTAEILDVILPLGGSYDGWGAFIVE